MILSNNAEAMPMLRLERVSPLALPGFLQGLGAVRTDFFLAREGGVHFVRLGPDFVLNGSAGQPLDPPPYMWGVSIAIKHSESFEFGFAHTTIFAGYGRPLNLKTFVHTFSLEGNAQAVDPGKRATEFNFSCHIPGIRKWLVLYSEGFAYDAPNPAKFAQRFAMYPASICRSFRDCGRWISGWRDSPQTCPDWRFQPTFMRTNTTRRDIPTTEQSSAVGLGGRVAACRRQVHTGFRRATRPR